MFPNLRTLYYRNGLKANAVKKMQEKFTKLKVLRCGVVFDKQKRAPRRVFKKRRTEGETVKQITELLEEFKRIAPTLEVRSR